MSPLFLETESFSSFKVVFPAPTNTLCFLDKKIISKNRGMKKIYFTLGIFAFIKMGLPPPSRSRFIQCEGKRERVSSKHGYPVFEIYSVSYRMLSNFSYNNNNSIRWYHDASPFKRLFTFS